MAQVLLLTAPEQARDVAFLLEEEGHEPCFLPVLGGVREVPAGLRAVAEQLQRFSWVFAVSRAPVRLLLEAIAQAGTRDRMKKANWLAGDAAIARMIERQGALVRVPGDGKWTSAINGLVSDEDEVLVLHDGPLDEVLADAIDATGCRSTFVEVPVEPVVALSAPEDAKVVVIHSPAAGEAWAELTVERAHELSESCCGPGEAHRHAPVVRLTLPEGLKVVAASSAIAETLASLGVSVDEVAPGGSADAVVDATIRALRD